MRAEKIGGEKFLVLKGNKYINIRHIVSFFPKFEEGSIIHTVDGEMVYVEFTVDKIVEALRNA